MTTLRLTHPGTIDLRQVTAALRALLSSQSLSRGLLAPRSFICLEVWATHSGIEHFITVPRAGAAITALTSALPGLRIESADRPTNALNGTTSGIQISGPTPGLLRTDITGDTSAALLASVSGLARSETVIVQWLITPLVRTRLPLVQEKALDKRQRDKRSETEIVASGRIAAWASTSNRARSLAHRTARVLQSVSGPDGSLRQRRTPRIAKNMVDIRPPLLVWPSHLNIDELGALVGWPTSSAPIRGLARGASRLLPPPSGAPNRGPSVGATTFPGNAKQIRLGTKGRLRHLHVVGPTGVGKTTLLTRLIATDIKDNRGVVVFDPLGDLTDQVCSRIPDSRRDDVIVLDPTDTQRPVGLNVLNSRDPNRNVDFLVGVMARLFASSWGPRTADILRAGLLTLSASPGSTLADLPDLLTNHSVRRRYVAPVMGDKVLAGFWTWFEALSEAERNSVIAPVLNKVRAVALRPEALRALCHPEGQLDLVDVFTKRRILIIRLAKGLVGEDTAALIGGLMLAKLWQTILGRAEVTSERRHPVFVYLDEFQDYLRLPIGMGNMLAQARGMGVGLIVAHQHLGQLTDGVKRDVLSNVGSRVIFQSTADDSRILARDLEPHLTAADLRGLGRREIAVRIATPDRVLPPFTGRTEPPDTPISDAADVRSHSQKTYGRPLIEQPPVEIDEIPVGRRRRSGGQQ